MDRRSISIVIPVYNEQDSLRELLGEIRATAGGDAEVLFVDDGSRDASWSIIRELAVADSRVGGLRFRANRGKAAALTAGFAAVRGELVFMMDADRQDPPQEMPRFIEQIDAGLDLVSGWKKVRHDPWHKVLPSRVFNHLIGLATGVHLHDHVCGYKCMRAEVARSLCIQGDLHRFIAVFAAHNGYKVTEITTLHRPRTTGCSKYGFSRFAKGLLDLLGVSVLTRFRRRPQHLIGAVGLWLAIILGLSVMVQIGLRLLDAIVRWGAVERFYSQVIPIWGGLVNGIYILTPALILIAIGIVAQMIAAQADPHEQYEIAERAGWCAAGQPARGE